MESSSSTSTTNHQRVTVDVPEDQVAEFHALFARFLTGRVGRGRRGRHGRPHRGVQGRCAGRRRAAEQAAPSSEAAGTTDV